MFRSYGHPQGATLLLAKVILKTFTIICMCIKISINTIYLTIYLTL